MTDWLPHLEPTEADVSRQQAEKLVNFLAPYYGDRHYKLRWLLDLGNLDLIKAEADCRDPASDRAYWGAVRSIAIRYYRRHCQSKGFERSQQPGRRDNGPAFGTQERKAEAMPRLFAVKGGEDQES